MGPFKKGAFNSLRAVTPILQWYDNGSSEPYNKVFRIQYDCIDWFSTTIFGIVYGSHTLELHEMPPFMPNDYLFKTHADKGKEKWEIFAWAVRDMMAKAGNFPIIDCDPFDKRRYEYFIRGRIDSIEAGGKTYELPPMRKNKKPVDFSKRS